MKATKYFILIGILWVLPLGGCGKDEPEPTDANQTTVGRLADKAERATQGATDFLAQQKDKLLTASQEQLNGLERQVNEWLGEAEIDDEQARQKLNAVTQSFRTAVGEAREAIAGAKDSGIEAWKEVKPTVETAVAKAQQVHDQIMAYLKDRAAKSQEPKPGEPVIEE